MKTTLVLAFAAGAFAFRAAPLRPRPALLGGRASQPAMLLDPVDVAHQASMLLADPVLLPDGTPDLDTVSAAAAAAEDPSWFDSLVVFPMEYAIVGLHNFLKSVGVDEAYGPSIIVFTIAVKAVTFPLTKTQIESTTKMQAIAPAAKALQEKYRERDPARLNSELQRLYQENQVNPLAGCLPSLAQIPLFIGLYRSLLNLAKEDKLTESFLFLPSLEGPVREYTEGISWLTEWQNGAPKLGWEATLAYLVLPVVLVISQYVSTSLLTPKSVTEDPSQAQSQAILKFLPLMIGWFSLNVPSGLGLYWLTNNVVTTASTLAIRATVNTDVVGVGAAAAKPAASEPKPAGFGRRYGEVISQTEDDGTTVTIKPPGATTRKERRAAAADPPGVVSVEATAVDAAPTAVAAAAPVAAVAADAGVSKSAMKKKKKASKKKK